MDYKTTQKQRDYAARVREQRRLSGLCIYCGQLPDPGYKTCYPCRSRFLRGGKHGCDKPGRNRNRKHLGLVDRRTKEYRDKIRGGPPKRRHRGP